MLKENKLALEMDKHWTDSENLEHLQKQGQKLSLATKLALVFQKSVGHREWDQLD